MSCVCDSGAQPRAEETLLELAKPVPYHRTAEFRQTLARSVARLQYGLSNQEPGRALTSSGTGGLEAAVVNCLHREQSYCLIAGRFGERWKASAKRSASRHRRHCTRAKP